MLVSYSDATLSPSSSALPVVSALGPAAADGSSLPKSASSQRLHQLKQQAEERLRKPEGRQGEEEERRSSSDPLLTVPGLPLSEVTRALQSRQRLSSLSSFMDPSNPSDWRDGWNDAPAEKAVQNMDIATVLDNSAQMVRAVKHMYQSARNKYNEYRCGWPSLRPFLSRLDGELCMHACCVYLSVCVQM